MTTQTVLQYNGIRLHNVQTLDFQQTPEYDETGLRYVHTKTSLRVIGYFVSETSIVSTVGTLPEISNYGIQVNGRGNITKGASQQYLLLKSFLDMPRRKLIYSTTANGTPKQPQGVDPFILDPALGTPLFIVNPASEDQLKQDGELQEISTLTDVGAGPIPRVISIAHVANNTTWKVEFSVEFWTVGGCRFDLNYGGTDQVTGESLDPTGLLDNQLGMSQEVRYQSLQRRLGVLNHSWSCTDQIDEAGYTTRVYTGKLTLANPHWNPNDYRALTIPPLTPGMHRVSIDYTASEDNLSLRYVITDKEVTVTAPWPAKKIKITHTEAVNASGFKVHFTVRIMLAADRMASLNDLRILALAIEDQRLIIAQRLIAGNKAAIFIDSREYTSEQGSDGTHSLMLTVHGHRYTEEGDVVGPAAIRDVMNGSVTWRLVDSPNGALFGYNNVLAHGNRPGEQPYTEENIPALSALHARLTTVCTRTFGTSSNVPTSTEIGTKLERTSEIRQSQAEYSSGMYDEYPTAITYSINTNVARSPTSMTYSSEHQNYTYSHYNITSTYGTQGLNVSLPVAATGIVPSVGGVGGYAMPVANIAVSIGPQQPTRKIRIEAERVGAPPRLPDPVASFSETALGAGTSSDTVKNTLHKSTVQHLNPTPTADGQSLLYTSYMDIDYMQNRFPAKHRTGIPDYMNPTDNSESPNSLSDVRRFSFDLSQVFIQNTLSNSWNT